MPFAALLYVPSARDREVPTRALRFSWQGHARDRAPTVTLLVRRCSRHGRPLLAVQLLDRPQCYIIFTTPAEAESARSALNTAAAHLGVARGVAATNDHHFEGTSVAIEFCGMLFLDASEEESVLQVQPTSTIEVVPFDADDDGLLLEPTALAGHAKMVSTVIHCCSNASADSATSGVWPPTRCSLCGFSGDCETARPHPSLRTSCADTKRVVPHTVARRAMNAKPVEGYRHVLPAECGAVLRHRLLIALAPFPPGAHTACAGPVSVPGLHIIQNYISLSEEAALMDFIDAAGARSDAWNSGMSRRVQHYGYGFDYVSRTAVCPNLLASGNPADNTSPASQTITAAPSGAGAGAAMPMKVMPLLPGTPLAALAAGLSRFGVVGDAGCAELSVATSMAPLHGVAGLGAFLSCRQGLPGVDGLSSPAPGRSALHSSSPLLPPPLQPPAGTEVASASDVFPTGRFPSPDQVTVNEYTPGVGIAGHADTHTGFEDGIVSLSLGGHTVMEFAYIAAEAASSHRSAAANTLPAAAAAALPGGGRVFAYAVLPARSLLVMRGEARYAWSHSIAARSSDFIDGRLVPRPPRRVSVTLRRVRQAGGPPCACAWPSVCTPQAVPLAALVSPNIRRLLAAAQAGGCAAGPDSTAGPLAGSAVSSSAAESSSSATSVGAAVDVAVSTTAGEPTHPEGVAEAPANTQTPQQLSRLPPRRAATTCSSVLATPAVESLHVHALYDAIAPHFSATRHSPWPRVEAFLRALPAASLVLDVGCGNGKYMGLRGQTSGDGGGDCGLTVIGCDRCAPLAAIAAGRGYEASVADALSLPYRPGLADAVLCIAVLHHISAEPRRVLLLRELVRVARPGGGCVLVQAWALEQGADSRRQFGVGAPPEAAEAAGATAAGSNSACAAADDSGPVGRDVFVPWNVSDAFLRQIGKQGTDLSAPAAAGATAASANDVKLKRRADTHAADKSKGAASRSSEHQPHQAAAAASEGAARKQLRQRLGGVVAGSLPAEVVAPASASALPPPHPRALPARSAPSASSLAAATRSSPIPEALALAGATVNADTGAVVLQRYCHMYVRGELERLLAAAVHIEGASGSACADCTTDGGSGGCMSVRLLESWWDRDNWCLLLERVR